MTRSLAELEAALRWALRHPPTKVPASFREASNSLAGNAIVAAPERDDADIVPQLDQTDINRRIAYWETFLADLPTEEQETERPRIEATLAQLRGELIPSAGEAKAATPVRRAADALPEPDRTDLDRRIAYWERFLADLSTEEQETEGPRIEATLAQLRRKPDPSASSEDEGESATEEAVLAYRQILAELCHDLPPCVVWRELSGDAALGGIEEGLREEERVALGIDLASDDIGCVRVFNGRPWFLRRQVFWAFLKAADGRTLCAPRLLLREGGYEPLDLLGDVDVVYGTREVEDLVVTTETAPAYLSMALDLVLKGRVRCPATDWPVQPALPEITEPSKRSILLSCRLSNGTFAARATFAVDRQSGHVTLANIEAA